MQDQIAVYQLNTLSSLLEPPILINGISQKEGGTVKSRILFRCHLWHWKSSEKIENVQSQLFNMTVLLWAISLNFNPKLLLRCFNGSEQSHWARERWH